VITRVRRPRPPQTEEAPQIEASSGLSALLEDPSRAGRVPGATRAKGLSDIDAAIRAAEARSKSGDWSDADARTMLGLYAWCHRSVYGVPPVELESIGEFRIASRAALRVLHDRFDDDGAQCAIFIRWSWKREKDRAAWAQREKKDRNRMGWRLQFSDRQVTDFRVAAAGRRS
jgi:hypothetical protein